MNAETPTTVELNLPQAFLLLATNDRDGKLEVPVFALRTTLAGAILAELNLTGAIGLEGKHVRATGTTPDTDFQRDLDLIRHKARPHTPRAWVAMLESRAEVQRVYEGMVALGIVQHVGGKHLGVFQTVRYPEKDHAPEAALLARIEAAFNAPSAPAEVPDPTADAPVPAAKPFDGRTLALIALLEAAGLLGKLFPEADRVWANELAKEYWPARAVEDELRMIRLAEEEAANL